VISEALTRWEAKMLPLLAVGIGVAIVALTWFGVRATKEWQSAAARAVARRADESADLLTTALTHDMRAAQTSVLASRDWEVFKSGSLADITDQVAAAFARYPYPESFFAWRSASHLPLTFFNRANRGPAWVPHPPPPNRYPVVIEPTPAVGDAIFDRLQRDAVAGRRYAVFETTLGGQRYQVVARLEYEDPFRDRLESVLGFTVNLDWIRRAYIPEISRQVGSIGSAGVDLDVAVLDEADHAVFGDVGGTSASIRTFPLMFFDPSIALLDPPTDLPVRTWKVRVSASKDPAFIWATRGADRALLVVSAAAIALALGLLLSIRAVRASVALSELRSDFVSTVTHELKTPLATIRAVGDTLVRGRLASADQSREYAQMLVQEAKHLTRLVDNLLAYARVTDVTEVYSFEPCAAAELIDDALRGFRQRLTDGPFAVTVDIPPDLPLIRADRTSMLLALDNLIDNAIRYSAEQRILDIVARSEERVVWIEIRDQGIGIPADELAIVHRKFVRGRGARAGGSGLGLAIVHRIVGDHAGRVTLTSAPGRGTTARLTLPVFGD